MASNQAIKSSNQASVPSKGGALAPNPATGSLKATHLRPNRLAKRPNQGLVDANHAWCEATAPLNVPMIGAAVLGRKSGFHSPATAP